MDERVSGPLGIGVETTARIFSSVVTFPHLATEESIKCVYEVDK